MTTPPRIVDLHERIAQELLAAAYSCDGTDCRASEDECEAAHPVRRPAPWRYVVRIEGSPEGLAAAMLPVVEAELAARDAEIARLRAELAAARNTTLTEAAELIRAACLGGGCGDWGRCTCDANADLLLAARTPTS
ncbi:hypothetical protein ABT093_09875 [Kitasatospora sp. NPDC002551]|uniref:hypothetical protein n=1 Tax=Kitasatospora sp. NPDC002551 TaxID=3154539 RepID=UPI00332E3FAF